ncbi:MAG: hydrolase [Oscillospiraceae bacterium]|nr:hydrolase [Oscillospiraceae bacterium]
MSIRLQIQNKKQILEPVAEGGITVEWEESRTPGKMSFSLLADKKLRIEQGNRVKLYVNKKPVFLGYIFIVEQGQGDTVKVICYDQLRYLKNKDTYIFENKTADEIIGIIAKDFQLSVGKLAGTGYKFESLVQDNRSLLDIVAEALEETELHKNKKYVFYDDFGKLCLASQDDLRLRLLADKDTIQDFHYSCSIDGETYNKIKLVHQDQSAGRRAVYGAQDKSNIDKWGILQYCESIDGTVNGPDEAEKLLGLYNRPARSLQLSGVLGDVRVRPGCRIYVNIKTYAGRINAGMTVERVTHNFSESLHTMDLTLKVNK